jgi:ubiquinone biosynthesis UbiH/UbiF/VisC/COQ6 family hydroxylase
MLRQRFDLIVVGGGLAGASLAVALGGSRLSVALVEARPPQRPEDWDARIYAVSPANIGFLSNLGVWQRLDQGRTRPVYDMEIYGDLGARLDFSAYGAGVAELAKIVESASMQCELWETAQRLPNLTVLCPAHPQALALDDDAARLTLSDGRQVEASLIVAADGANSWVRTAAGIEARFTPYGESGVVANFRASGRHLDKAYQWFRPDGVLAWLPLPGNMISMVWSTPDENAAELVGLNAAQLCERVAAAGGHRLGTLEVATPAAAFPLRLMRVAQTTLPRVALIGDAAHAIHPLSGHGINLGFQDAAVLARILSGAATGQDPGDPALLRRYARARAEEVAMLQYTTHGLQRLFRPQNAPLAALRNLGLNLTNRLPVLRNSLVRYALG